MLVAPDNVQWRKIPEYLSYLDGRYFVRVRSPVPTEEKVLYEDDNIQLFGHHNTKGKLVGLSLVCERQLNYEKDWFVGVFTSHADTAHADPTSCYGDDFAQLTKFSCGDSFNYAFALRHRPK